LTEGFLRILAHDICACACHDVEERHNHPDQSIAHPRLEQFYWIQQYKLGCGMGLRGDLAGDGGAMDHTSPWHQFRVIMIMIGAPD
jgi:hypothetical protein